MTRWINLPFPPLLVKRNVTHITAVVPLDCTQGSVLYLPPTLRENSTSIIWLLLCSIVCLKQSASFLGHVWHHWGGLPVTALHSEQQRREQRGLHDPEWQRGGPAEEECWHFVGHPEGPEGPLNTPTRITHTNTPTMRQGQWTRAHTHSFYNVPLC